MSINLITDNEQYVGVDKVRIAFPLEPQCNNGSAEIFTRNGFARTQSDGRLKWAEGFTQKGTEAPIYCKVINNGYTAIMEFNPSRQLDRYGSTLCAPDDVYKTVAWAVETFNEAFRPVWTIDRQTGAFIESPAQWPESWESQVVIRRLDLARDFSIEHPDFGLDPYLRIKKKGQKKDAVYRDNGEAQTIAWGRGNRLRTHFYNKSQAPSHKCEENQWRFEIQARRSWLRPKGIASLADISNELCIELLAERWALSRFDGEIFLGDDKVDFFEKAYAIMSPQKAMTFYGLACAMAIGHRPKMHPRMITEYEALGNSIGFQLGQPIQDFSGEAYGLDFSSGRLKRI
jgi:hypothetical protein